MFLALFNAEVKMQLLMRWKLGQFRLNKILLLTITIEKSIRKVYFD